MKQGYMELGTHSNNALTQNAYLIIRSIIYSCIFTWGQILTPLSTAECKGSLLDVCFCVILCWVQVGCLLRMPKNAFLRCICLACTQWYTNVVNLRLQIKFGLLKRIPRQYVKQQVVV